MKNILMGFIVVSCLSVAVIAESGKLTGHKKSEKSINRCPPSRAAGFEWNSVCGQETRQQTSAGKPQNTSMATGSATEKCSMS